MHSSQRERKTEANCCQASDQNGLYVSHGRSTHEFSKEFELSEVQKRLRWNISGVLRVQEERVEGESVQEESFEEFWIGDEEEEVEQDPEQDPLYQWYDVQDQEHG